jgi:hypothetical protein
VVRLANRYIGYEDLDRPGGLVTRAPIISSIPSIQLFSMDLPSSFLLLHSYKRSLSAITLSL